MKEACSWYLFRGLLSVNACQSPAFFLLIFFSAHLLKKRKRGTQGTPTEHQLCARHCSKEWVGAGDAGILEMVLMPSGNSHLAGEGVLATITKGCVGCSGPGVCSGGLEGPRVLLGRGSRRAGQEVSQDVRLQLNQEIQPWTTAPSHVPVETAWGRAQL